MILNYDSVTYEFDHSSNPLLDEVNLSLRASDRISILGENGVGKTTLLRLGAGLMLPDSGNVIRNDSRGISYLPQRLDFPGHITARSVIHYYEQLRENHPGGSLGERLNIPSFRDQPWRTLSGGERRRVGLFLALRKDASLYLLDEPLAGLSPEAVETVRDWVDVHELTVLMTTHRWKTVREGSERVHLLNDGQLNEINP